MEDWSGLLEKNRSLYHYNGHLKAIIAKWKYRGDTILVQIFAQPFRELAIKEFNNTEIVVPIPISTKRLYERTFNQAKLLAELLPFPNVEALILPVTQVKQSKKSRKQRLQLENNPFEVNKEVVESIKGKSILIVDDIYTTGATIYQAAKLLKDIGVNNICSITLARG